MRKIEAYKLASRQGETPLSDLRAFWILKSESGVSLRSYRGEKNSKCNFYN